MAFARVYSGQVELLSGKIVSVEVDTSKGLYSFNIVGMGDRSVDEARDRVSSALKNTKLESPKGNNEKTIVSLSPATIKKEGSHFDLSIAVGYLCAKGTPMRPLDHALFIGELGLDGTVRPVRGVLPIAVTAREEGFTELYVPYENATEAGLVGGLSIYPIKTLDQIINHLKPKENGSDISHKIKPFIKGDSKNNINLLKSHTDFGDIIGQESAKRGLMIAAAGGHNIIMHGPPGTGKTMLARALAGILPDLDDNHAMEVAMIKSISGTPIESLSRTPPFRSPHHTSSHVSIIGGGTTPRPGEVTLAHRGVLFLDEFPEFDRRVIEGLREPLEEQFVSIARAKGSALFPAQFLFVGAMNPCPCGYKNSKKKPCTCTASDLARYRKKLSGPLLDRIDLALYVGEIEYEKLSRGATEKQSAGIQEKIIEARKRALARGKKLNGELLGKELSKLAPLSKEAEIILNESARRLGLSARAYHRTQKLARTIADLDESETIEKNHILEAIRYRPQVDMLA